MVQELYIPEDVYRRMTIHQEYDEINKTLSEQLHQSVKVKNFKEPSLWSSLCEITVESFGDTFDAKTREGSSNPGQRNFAPEWRSTKEAVSTFAPSAPTHQSNSLDSWPNSGQRQEQRVITTARKPRATSCRCVIVDVDNVGASLTASVRDALTEFGARRGISITFESGIANGGGGALVINLLVLERGRRPDPPVGLNVFVSGLSLRDSANPIIVHDKSGNSVQTQAQSTVNALETICQHLVQLSATSDLTSRQPLPPVGATASLMTAPSESGSWSFFTRSSPLPPPPPLEVLIHFADEDRVGSRLIHSLQAAVVAAGQRRNVTVRPAEAPGNAFVVNVVTLERSRPIGNLFTVAIGGFAARNNSVPVVLHDTSGTSINVDAPSTQATISAILDAALSSSGARR